MTASELLTRFATPIENGMVAVTVHAFRCESCKLEFLVSLVRPRYCPACGADFREP